LLLLIWPVLSGDDNTGEDLTAQSDTTKDIGADPPDEGASGAATAQPETSQDSGPAATVAPIDVGTSTPDSATSPPSSDASTNLNLDPTPRDGTALLDATGSVWLLRPGQDPELTRGYNSASDARPAITDLINTNNGTALLDATGSVWLLRPGQDPELTRGYNSASDARPAITDLINTNNGTALLDATGSVWLLRPGQDPELTRGYNSASDARPAITDLIT